MRITYIYPPLFKGFYPMATRMITENLLRDKNLEVEFSDIPVKTYASNVPEKIYDQIMARAITKFNSNILAFLQQKYMVNNIFYVFMAHGYFDEYILDEFETTHVVITCINYSDLIIVKHLLETNKKVVMGGPLVNIGLSPEFIRQFLHKTGVAESKLNNDLIIVSGNIDLTTDLYEIIKDWKDADIINNNCGTMYECERDFLQKHYDDAPNIPVHFGFNNRCWYGKCSFCTYKKLPKMDFLENMEDAKVIDNIHNTMGKFKATHIRFVDSYFQTYDPSVRNILEHIKDYDITIYTGITLLKNKDYIEFVNKYVNCLLIGLESTSDFSLKYVNKGYTHKDVKLAFDNVIRYLDRKVFLEISIILDLPCKDKNDVRANYEKIEYIKQRLLDEGFNAAVHMNTLSISPNLELILIKNGLLRYSNERSYADISSGKNYLIYLLREAGMDNPLLLPSGCVMVDSHSPHNLLYGYASPDTQIIRYDIDGNVLPSDLNLMDENTMKRLLLRTRKRS